MIDPRTKPCRYSALKQFARSPLHYLHAMQDSFEETLAMRLGSGCHAIMFGTPYVVWEGKVRNGKVWDAFAEEHAGRLILSQSEMRQAQAMATALRANRDVMGLLEAPGVIHEQRIDWTWDGRAYRSTPDARSPGVLVDLKCLRSSEPGEVMWQSAKAHYHAQAALYRRALASIGERIDAAYLVVVENKPPHPVTVLRFGANALERGDAACLGWDQYRRVCEDANIYPGYVQTVTDLDLPGDDGLIWPDDNTEQTEAA